jgi:hypothetical protein
MGKVNATVQDRSVRVDLLVEVEHIGMNQVNARIFRLGFLSRTGLPTLLLLRPCGAE